MCIYICIGYQEYDLALWKDGWLWIPPNFRQTFPGEMWIHHELLDRLGQMNIETEALWDDRRELCLQV